MISSFNWVDYTILVLFLFSTLAGLSRGLVKEIISLITLIAAFVLATIFASTLAVSFTNSSAAQDVVTQASGTMGANAATSVSYAALGISFGLIFLATIIIGSIIGFIINLALTSTVLGFTNRFLGACFGLFRGMCLALGLIFILQLTAVNSQIWWHESVIVKQYQPAVVWLGNMVSPSLANLKEKFDTAVQNLGAQVQSTSSSSTDTDNE